MAKVINLPINSLDEKDKKIMELTIYIKNNLMNLAQMRRELIALKRQLIRLNTKTVNEQSDVDRKS